MSTSELPSGLLALKSSLFASLKRSLIAFLVAMSLPGVKNNSPEPIYRSAESSYTLIDLFGLDGLLAHFRPCDDTLENFRFQISSNSRVHINK